VIEISQENHLIILASLIHKYSHKGEFKRIGVFVVKNIYLQSSKDQGYF